ncbi:MAG: DegT/DnrJ/EryC1/StrS family aminotransferase, partial [Candidatus Omnitrophica bacterium]|nr:DegT/DnrJ/EryC1/StrS family aminotransferase [Candidatus Omnitrophota bacterium]
MNIFREIPPTAGFPIWFKDFFSKRKPGTLEQDFQAYLKVPYAAITYSGTAALYFILETIKKFSDKTTVIVPSFVCPLVPLAVVRAGLKVEVCDIQSGRFDYDQDELEKICRDNKNILAVVTVHLAGIPVDLTSVGAITKKYGVFLVEDCAQALGAEYKGQRVGTFGDFGFFSLCRGKGLTIYEGGVAVCQPNYILALKETISVLEKRDFFSEALKIIELFGYAIFYRPLLFWFVFTLPQIFWQNRQDSARAMGEYATQDFPTHQVSGFRKSLGHAFFYHLNEEIV